MTKTDNRLPSKGRTGILCTSCGKILVSWSVHNYKTCGCPNKTMIDGGSEYLRYGAKDMGRIQIVTIKPTKEKK